MRNPARHSVVLPTVKLIVAALICAAAGGVLLSLNSVHGSARSPPPPELSALQLCRSGGVELVDERCDLKGACAKQSVRLAWDRGAGVLFEGDSTGEKELRRISAPELGRLLVHLTGLEPLDTDAERLCGRWGPDECTAAERALTITTDCGRGGATFTFIGAKPAWDRVRSTCESPWSAEHAKCLAQNTWQAAFATRLVVRFGTVFHSLRDAGRGG